MLDSKESAGLRFEVFQGIPGLEKLAPAWRDLLAKLPTARFVHYPEWYRAYLASRDANPSRVRFIAAWRGAELAAICPLQFQDYRVGRLQPKLLGTIDDDEMQTSDFIAAPAAAGGHLLDELTHWLRSQRGVAWDELRLRKVPEDSAIANSARTHMPKATLALRYDASSYFDTSGSYDQATQAMSGKFKRNLRRLAGRAESTAPLRHQSYRTTEELASAFEIFLQIEASGWKGDVGTSSAIRCSPSMRAFYQALVHEFSALNASVINVLWHGDHPVAGQFCLHVGSCFNVLKIGFSDAHSSFAPGNLLLDRMIRQACDDPSIDTLSLVNAPPWARNFKPLTLGVWSYCTPNWNAGGAIVHLGLLAKRAWESRRQKGAVGGAAHTDEEVAA